jgi:type I restriction enzyme R subunit
MQKMQSSKSRLQQIVNDILLDMETKPRLMDGRGNAMLVCASVYQACKAYEMFSQTDMAGKIAIVTSFQPTAASIKGEETGAGLTEKLFKFDIYRKMLADYFEQSEDQAVKRVEEFESAVKKSFVHEPGQMRLLIVVDKLLTGFDAPSATYLYIDKQMADHSLFQAICRVNRLDGDDKEYGYIVDYRDLFGSLKSAVEDYTSGALDGYDKEDVKGLLKDRLQLAKIDLDNALEIIRALCEPVSAPRQRADYWCYFCDEPLNKSQFQDIATTLEKEALRLTLYRAVAKLLRAFANIANEMLLAGYNQQQIKSIRDEIWFYQQLRDEVKAKSGDLVDMKRFEPAMRHLLDTYIRADDSEVLMDFEELGLIELIVQQGDKALDKLPKNIRQNPEAMAETIENNIRKTIVDENPVNPKYYEQMSVLLNELTIQRRQQALDYHIYLQRIRTLARQVLQPEQSSVNYPPKIDTNAKRAFYDNFGHDENLATEIDNAIRYTKKADWIGDRFKEREITNAVRAKVTAYDVDIAAIIDLAKSQKEYK